LQAFKAFGVQQSSYASRSGDLVSLAVWKCTIYSTWKNDTSMFGSFLIPLVCKWRKLGWRAKGFQNSTHWGCHSTTPAVRLAPGRRSNGLSKQSRFAWFAFASPFQPGSKPHQSIARLALATYQYWLSAVVAVSRLEMQMKSMAMTWRTNAADC
jgi:hypothetical protein